MENSNREKYEALKNTIEELLGRKVATKRDYEYLSMRILDRTGSYISPITLRRFWGNLADGKYNTIPRRFTIDTLAQYIGHIDFYSFEQNCKKTYVIQSNFIASSSLQTTELQ